MPIMTRSLCRPAIVSVWRLLFTCVHLQKFARWPGPPVPAAPQFGVGAGPAGVSSHLGGLHQVGRRYTCLHQLKPGVHESSPHFGRAPTAHGLFKQMLRCRKNGNILNIRIRKRPHHELIHVHRHAHQKTGRPLDSANTGTVTPRYRLSFSARGLQTPS